MRSRTVREGSVGLLLLLGIACFGGLVLWLGRFTIGSNSYEFVVNFLDAGGMQTGAPVRYRGVVIGKITAITPGPNGVAVTVTVSPADLIIPRDGVRIEANQSGLIGETSIDITPSPGVKVAANVPKPLERNCNSDVIICHKSRLDGVIGVSFNELIRSTVELTKVVNNPVLFENINGLVKNSAAATAGVTDLTKELSNLSKSVREELGSFSGNANNLTLKANQIGDSVDRVVNQVGGLTAQFSNSMGEFTQTANQIKLSAGQANELIANVNGLVVSNRSNLVSTLDNLSQTSQELRGTVGSLGPVLDKVKGAEFISNLDALTANAVQASANLRQLSEGQMVRNLETVTANAAQASANLRQLSDPSNLMTLQQTLDSARMVFQNAEKITADLDDLTGDPAFRENMRRLVNGLSGLVSSTQQLQDQVRVAESVTPLQEVVDKLVVETADVEQLGGEVKKDLPVSNEPVNAREPMLPVSASMVPGD